MEQKQRFFIYDRREMGVLILLGVAVAAFAFTLGVHLGKRATLGQPPADPGDATLVKTTNDKVPNRQEIREQTKGVPQAVDESLNQSLHDEVARTCIRLDVPRPVELPEDARSKNAGATTASNKPSSYEALNEHSLPASRRKPEGGKYTLQIGSHQKLEDARDQLDALEALGLKPLLRKVDLQAKGRWFRIYMGGFENRDEAEEAGARYQAKNVIESFIVANQVEK